MMRLKDKVALITGAGRGIGLAGAIAFASEGAKVVIAEINEELGSLAVEKIRNRGGEATFFRTDCSDPDGVRMLMAKTKELYGGIHVLYNNASVFLDGDKPVTELPEDI